MSRRAYPNSDCGSLGSGSAGAATPASAMISAARSACGICHPRALETAPDRGQHGALAVLVHEPDVPGRLPERLLGGNSVQGAGDDEFTGPQRAPEQHPVALATLGTQHAADDAMKALPH